MDVQAQVLQRGRAEAGHVVEEVMVQRLANLGDRGAQLREVDHHAVRPGLAAHLIRSQLWGVGAASYVELSVSGRTVRVSHPEKVFFGARGENLVEAGEEGRNYLLQLRLQHLLQLGMRISLGKTRK